MIMDQQEIFMPAYRDKGIKITFLDNLFVIGLYVNYYYSNNVIVICPEEAHDDTRMLIPMTAIKKIEPWSLDDYELDD